MQCELSAEARDAMVTLIYREWAQSCDILKAVKAEKNDGSEDWNQFHDFRLKKALSAKDNWFKILEEVKRYSPLMELVDGNTGKG